MSLIEKKKEISEKYLGKAGVHGVGVSRQRGAIKLHVSRPHSERQRQEQDRMLEKLRREAAPYGVLTFDDNPAAITGE